MSRHMGLSSDAPKSSVDQQRSTVFDVDQTQSDRIVGRPRPGATKPFVDDADLPTKPFGRPAKQQQHPAAAVQPAIEPPLAGSPTLRRPGPASCAPVDISEASASPTSRRPALEDVEAVLEALRAALRSRGAVGIQGIRRNFKICDTDGSRKLDRDELAKCLRLCKLELTDAQFDTLFTHVDADGSGRVDYDEFLRAVRGRLAPLRRKLVVNIFNGIDQRPRRGAGGLSDGVLTAADLRDVYSAKEHPEVKAGKKTESAILGELLNSFEGKGGNRDGTVTLEEWIGYYEEVSASIDLDEYFATMLVSAWATLFDPKVMGKAVLSKPVPASKVSAIEKQLVEAIRIRSSGASETRALETTFKQFDSDKNGTIEFDEFRGAMERFGLATGGYESVSGCTVDVIRALFDRYDPDGSGTLTYAEFIKGIFRTPDAPPTARAKGTDLTGGTGTSLQLPSERGAGSRPATAGEYARPYARGHGGVMGSTSKHDMNTQSHLTAAAGAPRNPGASFNQSSGIFR